MTHKATQAELDDLCAELKSKYNCHTIILYGSRARGDECATSDYDILGIRESGESVRDARLWRGQYLDAFIHPESKCLNPDEKMIHMHDGRVLCEKNSFGTEFLSKLRNLVSIVPLKLPADETEARKVWARKMLDRARTGDTEGNYRRVWLLTALLEDYFLIRGQRYLGPKKSLQQLKSQNLPHYELFENALKPDANLADITQLVDTVIT